MYPITAEVMSFELDSDRDTDSVDVTLKLRRHPAEVRYLGLPPDVNDMPWDFRNALEKWLGLDSTPPRDPTDGVLH